MLPLRACPLLRVLPLIGRQGFSLMPGAGQSRRLEARRQDGPRRRGRPPSTAHRAAGAWSTPRRCPEERSHRGRVRSSPRRLGVQNTS